ncbi:MAG: aldehyde oxidase and xanthine dehydrogenase molybdopterin binding protein [Actinomycetia bacterium]|nr:aldehyde oxidase and xanthine dehydrogenase molybdopterin binding protein [Actinomycetes bacterium]
MSVVAPSIGAPADRIEGRDKVAGKATYAFEYEQVNVAYAAIVQSSIAKGTVRAVDSAAALALPGVLAVLSHENAPTLSAEGELAVLQSLEVSYRGQIVAAVIADSLETARHAGQLVRVDYDVAQHDVELRPDHPRLYKPDRVNPNFPTDSEQGDVEQALATATITVDETYTTPAQHNNPMEPHATIAVWENDGLTLYDSNQGAWRVAQTLAPIFGIDVGQVRVISPHVGGGFGSKGTPRPHAVLAAMCAQHVQRAVKLAVTRQQMFTLTGYRTPTIQRLQLGADRDGRISAIAHDVVEQTSTVQEFAEQTAVATRMMYASPNRRTTHRLVALNLPTPAWMRAPGECPGMYALESALDELAVACDLDPVELRIRNEPDVDPETGNRFSTRNLVACLREGAQRFGWSDRIPEPASRRAARWMVGMGVAAATYPARRAPSTAHANAEADGTFTIRITASDIGTGARTVLTQIAADTLDAPIERVRVEIGDSSSGPAQVAGGSSGTSSWGTAVVKACRLLRAGQTEVSVDTSDDVDGGEPLTKQAFGAHFAEVLVDVDTGEVRVPRMVGVFGCGRIINPKTARSQFIGGMTMGVSMALFEETLLDPHLGAYVNHDLAMYHVPTNADIGEIDVAWIDEEDFAVNPMGAKGLGEIGIVGCAAAVANAVYNATGIRIRDLPITPAKLVGRL